MKINEIKKIAKSHNIKAGKLNKGELVRAIQLAEGNPQCFASNSSGECGQKTCIWRVDCV